MTIKFIHCLAGCFLPPVLCLAGAGHCPVPPDSVSFHPTGDKSGHILSAGDSMRPDSSTLLYTGTKADPFRASEGNEKHCPAPSPGTDFTFSGFPWIIAGAALRGQRTNIRSLRQKFQYNFHSPADNYLQYSPLLLTTGLKAAGVEGRSTWGRYAVSAAASYAVMALLVNSIKYTAREQRPDGSTRNSFPSGHTATAFAAATILHKEYGLTRSPWYSIGGYMMATATGCMRVLNNRHWVSDTFAGAGIGILSAELGYTLADLLFRQHGLRRPDRTAEPVSSSRPSFFSIQTGVGLGKQQLDILLGNEVLQDDYEEENVRGLKLSHALSVSSEGAYFFNRYLGIGGRVRVVSRAVKNLDDFTKQSLYDFSKTFPDLDGFMDDYELTVQSDHLAEFSLSGGLYFNLPLTSRISLGTKLLFGRSYMRDVDIDARVRGHQRDLDFSYEVYKGKRRITCEVLGERKDNGDVYDCSWDYLTVMGNKAFTIGTGLSVNFSYKSLTAWRIFLDYDYSHRNYTIVYDPMHFLEAAARNVTFNGRPVSSVERYVKPNVTSLRKGLSQTVLGAAFSITF